MRTYGFTDRSMFDPADRQNPNAPRDASGHEMLPLIVVLVQDRPKSLIVYAYGDDAHNTVSLPRSLLEIEPVMFGDRLNIKAPRWLLQREGLAAFVDDDKRQKLF